MTTFFLHFTDVFHFRIHSLQYWTKLHQLFKTFKTIGIKRYKVNLFWLVCHIFKNLSDLKVYLLYSHIFYKKKTATYLE